MVLKKRKLFCKNERRLTQMKENIEEQIISQGWSTPMNFRQRIAWLGVGAFLSASFGFVYYIFEINDHFNAFALEHVKTFHGEDETMFAGLPLWSHITDIPLAVWMLVFLLPYLQVFAMLLAWTKPEPWRSTAFQWPGLVYFKSRRFYSKCFGLDRRKAMNSHVNFNGHIIIDAWLNVYQDFFIFICSNNQDLEMSIFELCFIQPTDFVINTLLVFWEKPKRVT